MIDIKMEALSMLEDKEEVHVSTDIPSVNAEAFIEPMKDGEEIIDSAGGTTLNDEPFIPPRDLSDISINFMWLRLMNAISEEITADMLSLAKIGASFPVIEKTEDAVWRRSVIKKVRKNKCQIIDERGIAKHADVDNPFDPITLWGQCYKHPTKQFYDEAKAEMERGRDDGDGNFYESPTRKESRNATFEAQMKQGREMRSKATKEYGEIEVGTIGWVAVSDFDLVKVDGKNLTIVVVEKVRGTGYKQPPKYRLASKHGVLQNLYHRSYITVIEKATPKLMGLESILENWNDPSKKIPILYEREAAKKASLVGGQGTKNYCGCQVGKCSSNLCVCFKAKRVCNSRCHGSLPNINCKNATECENC